MKQVMSQFTNHFMPHELIRDPYTSLRLHVRTYVVCIGLRSMKAYESRTNSWGHEMARELAHELATCEVDLQFVCELHNK